MVLAGETEGLLDTFALALQFQQINTAWQIVDRQSDFSGGTIGMDFDHFISGEGVDRSAGV